MKLKDLFIGPFAPVFSHVIVFVILVIMFVVSLRLYVDRRKKGYLSMTISLTILILHYLLMIYFDFGNKREAIDTYISMLLGMVSFVLVNMGFFQIYNRARRKHYLFFYGLIAGGFLVSLLHFYVPVIYNAGERQVYLLQVAGMELYMFVLIFLCFYLLPPAIGQQIKYQFALSIYFTNQITHILNAYMFDASQPFLSIVENMLPIVFYFLLFLMLFEKVIEFIQAIYNSSITDGLTHLFNRKYFSNRVAQYIARNLPISILFSDIDNFKKLNDTKGHQMGDNILRQVAAIMKEESEDFGIAGRYGGEEIVLMITDPSVNMEAFAERVRQRVEDETLVTVSLGYSKYDRGVTAEQLIKQADEAMYKAKTSGKNKVVRYG